MMPAVTVERTRNRRLLVALLVVIGLLLGFALAALLFREERPTNFSGPPSVTSIDLPAAGAVGAATPVVLPATLTEPGSAEQALEQFLVAEAGRRSDVSFALVDAATAERVGSVAAWQSERANRLVPTTFTIVSATPVDGGVDVTITAARPPAVTRLTGLEPARSTEVWRVVRGDAGWRVQGGRPAGVTPELPSDAAAVTAAAAWLERAVACDTSGRDRLQLPGELLGAPVLADAPCERPNQFFPSASAVPLAELANSTAFVSAYGPGVGRWGRAVAVSGDPRITIVLAPLGDEWRVMGLVPEGSPGS